MVRYLIGCWIVLCCSIAAAAQTACDSLERHLSYLDEIYKRNRMETNLDKREKLHQVYIAESKKGAEMAGRCFKRLTVSTGSIDHLKNNYLVGKLYLQAQECAHAQQSFDLCLGNPHCGTEKIGTAGTYAQVIGRCTCNRSQLEGSTTANGYSLDYDGKGNAFVRNIFATVEESVYNEMPLLPDEIEKIMGRTVRKNDSVDREKVSALSGNDNYILAPPFLLMQAGGSFVPAPLKWEKNLLLNTQPGNTTPNLSDFNAFLQKHYQALKNSYFDKLDLQDKLISVYLAGGGYNQTGVKEYLSFCNNIHYRAWKKVAYYMPLDNSIVAWATSGGGTLVHELVHALMAGDFPQAPWWLNEGMASLQEEANDSGVIANNYRLIFVQYAIDQDQYCIDWRDLVKMNKYEGADQTNYNLLNGYSRYFCKFINDRLGKEGLAAIYRNTRNNWGKPGFDQATAICRKFRVTADQLQQQWLEYLLTERVTQRWEPAIRGMVNDFPKDYRYQFKKAAVTYPEQRLKDLKEYYKARKKLTTAGSSAGHGIGPQQN